VKQGSEEESPLPLSSPPPTKKPTGTGSSPAG